MLRLADRVMRCTRLVPHYFYEPLDPDNSITDTIKTELATCPKIVIDNVAELCSTYDNTRQMFRGTEILHAPPFETFWMEFVVPEKLRDVEVEFMHGCMCYGIKLTDGWEMKMLPVMLPRGREPASWLDYWVAAVGENGALRSRETSCAEALRQFPDVAEEWAGTTDPIADVYAIALTFMHCRNVTHHEHCDESPKMAKWRRRQKVPKLIYRTLEIGATGSTSNAGDCETAGDETLRRLHICRGHFATYTEDRPLFGHVTGTFWKPAHVRGSAKAGVVVKDYAVKSPAR